MNTDLWLLVAGLALIFGHQFVGPLSPQDKLKHFAKFLLLAIIGAAIVLAMMMIFLFPFIGKT